MRRAKPIGIHRAREMVAAAFHVSDENIDVIIGAALRVGDSWDSTALDFLTESEFRARLDSIAALFRHAMGIEK